MALFTASKARLLAALVAASVAFSGCPDEDEPSTPDTSGDVSADAPSDGGGDATGPDGTTTPDDGTPDATPDGGTPDAQPDATPDAAPDAEPDVPVIPPDGLLGSPCEQDSDCNITGTDDDACFFGFCTTRCSQQGEPIAGACVGPDKVSAASPYGQFFGCPEDIIYCTPGNVSGVPIICSENADCTMGNNFHCAGAINVGNRVVEGVCLPTGDLAPSGSDCFDPNECASLLCLGEDEENNIPGQCVDHCETNADCPGAGDLCVGIGYVVTSGAEVPGAWAGLCIDAQSSQTYCNKADKCGDGEVCQVFVEPSSLGPQYWCIPQQGAAAPGEPCDTGSDCTTGRCFFGGVTEVEQGYCASLCPGGDDDCGYGTCEELSLTASGTPDNPNDDPQYEVCVFGALDDNCFVDEPDFCQGDLLCEQVPDATNNLGTCVEPPGCDSGAVICDDGLSCTVDACVDNACTTNGLEADTCLIDGACYAVNDPNPANPCELCDPTSATDAWTAATDGTLCEAGDFCFTGDSCQSGACVEGTTPFECDPGDACTPAETCEPTQGCVNLDGPIDCDDGFDCTVDTCDPATGCVHTPDNSVCDGGDADVCDGTTVCDPSDAGADVTTGCVAVGPLNCDDNDVCNGTETCDPTDGCQPGTALECDDGDVCNGAELCSAADGCQPGTPLECDDSDVCNGTETCDAINGCQGGTPLECDDGDACNGVEICDATNGCGSGTAPVCDDGDACNGTESCDTTDGCVAGIAIICDDADICTIDSCDPGTGACSNDPDTVTCPTITISDTGYSPDAVTIPVGATVTWNNADNSPHTVEIAALTVDSGNIANAGTFAYIFDTAGVYAVTDSFSANTMTVTVQ